MKGLIKKDLLVVKSNAKILFILLVALSLLAIKDNSSDILVIMPIFSIMMFVSTFSYDEFNKFNTYVSTLPNGRKEAVKAKYISTFIVILFLLVVSFLLALGVGYSNKSLDMSNIISTLVGSVFACVFVVSLLYPLMYKYGAMNGRLIIFGLVIGISMIGSVLSKIVNLEKVINYFDSLGNLFFVITMVVSLLIIIISYFISVKIYKNKEF